MSNKINQISQSTIDAIIRKSAAALPLRPSEQGYSGAQIRAAMHQYVTDLQKSVVAEIQRIVGETNEAFNDVVLNFEEFVNGSVLEPPFILEFGSEQWSQLNADEYILSITKAEHGIQDYREIKMLMYIQDSDGKYVHVNQYKIGSDATVYLYSDLPNSGFVTVARNRDAFVAGDVLLEAESISGLSDVAKSGNYNDLNNKPNIQALEDSAVVISQILSGATTIPKATFANSSQNANYADNAGVAGSANTALSATRATQDAKGANIETTYAKQNGNYQSMTVGKATNADKAKQDEHGVNINATYAKQNGNYPNMTVGKSTNADKATNADKSNEAKTAPTPNLADRSANIANTAWVKNLAEAGLLGLKVTSYQNNADGDSRMQHRWSEVIMGDYLFIFGRINAVETDEDVDVSWNRSVFKSADMFNADGYTIIGGTTLQTRSDNYIPDTVEVIKRIYTDKFVLRHNGNRTRTVTYVAFGKKA